MIITRTKYFKVDFKKELFLKALYLLISRFQTAFHSVPRVTQTQRRRQSRHRCQNPHEESNPSFVRAVLKSALRVFKATVTL